MINNSSPNKLLKIPATLGRQPKYRQNEGCLSDPKTTNLPLTSLPARPSYCRPGEMTLRSKKFEIIENRVMLISKLFRFICFTHSQLIH